MLLRYTGSAPTERTWRGAESRTGYRFGGERRVGYVDKRDALAWLSDKRGQRPFELAR